GPRPRLRWHVAFVAVRKRLSCASASRGTWGEGSCGCGWARIATVVRAWRENRSDGCVENKGGGGNATGCDRRARPVHGLAVLDRAQPVPLLHGGRLPRPAVLVAGSPADPARPGPGVLEDRPLPWRLALRQPSGPAEHPQGEP